MDLLPYSNISFTKVNIFTPHGKRAEYADMLVAANHGFNEVTDLTKLIGWTVSRSMIGVLHYFFYTLSDWTISKFPSVFQPSVMN